MEGQVWESGGTIEVDGGVESGVVVHFELLVELETARADEGGLPEVFEAVGEVGALGFEDGETIAIALGVAGWRGWIGDGAVDFFARMEDLEGEEGEAVDH